MNKRKKWLREFMKFLMKLLKLSLLFKVKVKIILSGDQDVC